MRGKSTSMTFAAASLIFIIAMACLGAYIVFTARFK